MQRTHTQIAKLNPDVAIYMVHGKVGLKHIILKIEIDFQSCGQSLHLLAQFSRRRGVPLPLATQQFKMGRPSNVSSFLPSSLPSLLSRSRSSSSRRSGWPLPLPSSVRLPEIDCVAAAENGIEEDRIAASGSLAIPPAPAPALHPSFRHSDNSFAPFSNFYQFCLTAVAGRTLSLC